MKRFVSRVVFKTGLGHVWFPSLSRGGRWAENLASPLAELVTRHDSAATSLSPHVEKEKRRVALPLLPSLSRRQLLLGRD